MNCEECGKEIKPPKRSFCSRKCSGTWRRKNVYKDKYTNKYRAKSPRNFMMCLIKKKRGREKLDIDLLERLYNYQKGLCSLTGIPMTYITGKGKIPTNISIDRIDSNKGYEINNIRLVCRHANCMKMELTDEQLIWWCNRIIEEQSNA